MKTRSRKQAVSQQWRWEMSFREPLVLMKGYNRTTERTECFWYSYAVIPYAQSLPRDSSLTWVGDKPETYKAKSNHSSRA